MRISARTAAKIGICVQFAALIRCLGEYFRLRHVFGAQLTLPQVEPFLMGALVTSILALASVLLYFTERYALAATASAVNVALLIAFRFLFF